ncbi:MAG TPA: tRNA (pseudouridine(54)-N(1))-methyltransferase TrmY [Candidatus Acetothermia bacterium]|nr:tRNA (pseudouridine(54)-N(1))-methyltransferase TrmY [Candidatus Acetothermia bacterium]HEX32388.1 tRNA (pseudouridine(54)-N(1))-methyltransferase TrmY [Candidatus Acetothermia bacterium]
MRRFVLLAHKAPVAPDFTLNDLPGSAGRIDVLCRAIGAAFFLSHDLRRDVEVDILLQDQVQIRLVGEKLKRLNPDERSTAALIKHALEKLVGEEEEVQSTPGIFVSRRTLPEMVDRLYQLGAHPVVLHEEGAPFEAASIPDDPAFFLSDHQDFSPTDEEALADLPRVSLGSTPLHTSQCITIVHYLLDRQREDEGDLVMCHKVWEESKAHLIKGLLEDFGIPANLVRHVPPSVLPITVDGLSEVRIMVRPRDLQRAREIISDYFEPPIDE